LSLLRNYGKSYNESRESSFAWRRNLNQEDGNPQLFISAEMELT